MAYFLTLKSCALEGKKNRVLVHYPHRFLEYKGVYHDLPSTPIPHAKLTPKVMAHAGRIISL